MRAGYIVTGCWGAQARGYPAGQQVEHANARQPSHPKPTAQACSTPSTSWPASFCDVRFLVRWVAQDTEEDHGPLYRLLRTQLLHKELYMFILLPKLCLFFDLTWLCSMSAQKAPPLKC